ncbi:hypothetical protein FRB94_000538 [Tulasnella sp. JGI-2019a]|nr:hypothetical protein FRB94_000538 [Tulasnella sp. JGI-2019a]KAG9016132.1 hypothetical protein FRB93_011606 [Tulasnella sp. JGI-2019a]KAG9032974.1 hypothetical protein FRB95_000722 [Tulasnella sp. JGI-2019a]
MYGGDAMDTKATVDPYADPPAPVEASAEAALPQNPTNGAQNGDAKADRGRERSRSRSRSPVGRSYRSPRRDSPPPSYQRRRSPPPPRRPPHAPQAPTPTQVLGVFGLSIRTVERQLDEEFSRYGTVDKVTIVYDARTGRSRGFGFIKMNTVEEATACIEKLNGIEIDGRRLRVDYSVTERPHQPTPGEYMGTRREADRYSGSGGGRYDDRDRDRDRRDRGDSYYHGGSSSSRRDRDRDPYGRDSYRDRDWRDADRDRDRDWRDKRSPRGSSPPPRRRRSHSRSPPPRASGSTVKDDTVMRGVEGDRGAPRW